MSRASTSSVASVILLAGLVVCAPVRAAAQSPSTNVSLTYTFLRDTGEGQSFTAGATVGVTLRIRGWLAATAEAGLSADSKDYSSSGGGVWDYRYTSFHAGPRVARPEGTIRPYGQLLAGATRWQIRETQLAPSDWDGTTDFSLQPGAGLDVFLTRRVALRFAGDVQVLFRHESRFDTNYRTYLYRFHAGVSFHFGGQ